MFGRFFLKRKQKEYRERLQRTKDAMDEAVDRRPWRDFRIDADLAAGMGAFEENAVTEDDFYDELEGFLEDLFYSLEDETDGAK